MKKLILMLAAVLTAAVSAWAAPLPENAVWTARVDSLAPDKGAVVLTATMTEGWHIYGFEKPSADATMFPTEITATASEGLEWTDDWTPSRAASEHFDALLQLKLPWWDGSVDFTRHFRLGSGADAASIKVVAAFMVCNAQSCTAPDKRTFELRFGTLAAAVATPEPAAAGESAAAVAAAPESEWWAPVVTESASDEVPAGMWALLGFGFLGGLLALLTPCVWPMIPMTVSFFLKRGRSRSRSIADALIYGASIIVIYLLLGIAITLIFGAGKLNEIATGAVFNVVFFVLLVVFAVSFFGAFDIKLPSRWSAAVDSKAENTSGMFSIFLMAFTLVLVSFSCTGPIIGTLLVEAASQGNVAGPAMGMGGFALGLALPFALFAFFPSMLKEMPRSGGWLNSVKVVLGFVELILSLKFLSVADLAYGWHILDREVFLSLWIVLFVLLGMYLLGKLRFSHDSPSAHTGVGGFFLAVCSLSFAVYLVPGLWGAPLKAISAFAPPLHTQDFNLYGGQFKEFDDYDEGMRYAAAHNMPVLVDFSGYACVNCRKMEGAVFDTPAVRAMIEDNFVLVKLMVDDKAPLATPYAVEENGRKVDIETVGERWSYLQRHKFGSATQPYYVMLDNGGLPLGPSRSYDENAAAFMEWLEAGLATYQSK
ncbi:MAG: thioredoxin family protein [Muribaculaceae bacterium]|nr:thioredoxin family protein [Muribaculaceae bacterium]